MKTFPSKFCRLLVIPAVLILAPQTAARSEDAVLSMEESTAAHISGREYKRYDFRIDTGAARFHLLYKSFPGPDAEDNPTLLNDLQSGYGMIEPSGSWYGNGMLNVIVIPEQGFSPNIAGFEGIPRVLEDSGSRVAYDLLFDLNGMQVVVRTVALAGRQELFIRVYSAQGLPLCVQWLGFPCGGAAVSPGEHCVITAGGRLKRKQPAAGGVESFQIELGGPGGSQPVPEWMVLTDLQLNADGDHAHQLGLIFDKLDVQSANVVFKGGIVPEFYSIPGATSLSFVVCDLEAMSVTGAEEQVARLAGESVALWEQAFENLPEP